MALKRQRSRADMTVSASKVLELIRDHLPHEILQGCLRHHVLFRYVVVLRSKVQWERLNDYEAVLEKLMEVSTTGIPKKSVLAEGLVGLDKYYNNLLSGFPQDAVMAKLWALGEAHKLRNMLSHVWTLSRRAVRSKSQSVRRIQAAWCGCVAEANDGDAHDSRDPWGGGEAHGAAARDEDTERRHDSSVKGQVATAVAAKEAWGAEEHEDEVQEEEADGHSWTDEQWAVEAEEDKEWPQDSWAAAMEHGAAAEDEEHWPTEDVGKEEQAIHVPEHVVEADTLAAQLGPVAPEDQRHIAKAHRVQQKPRKGQTKHKAEKAHRVQQEPRTGQKKHKAEKAKAPQKKLGASNEDLFIRWLPQLPQECQPPTASDKVSWTWWSDDGATRIVVNLKNAIFFRYKPGVGRPNVAWKLSGGPAPAWSEAKKRAGVR